MFLFLVVSSSTPSRAAPTVFATPEALRAFVDTTWTNSFSAATLPPGCTFFHDLGVLATSTNFPVAFFAGCEPITQDGIPMHAVEVTETNDVTRVWSCPGAEIGSFPVPADYDATAWALARFPVPGYLGTTTRQQRIQDAKLGGRQTLRLRLIPEASIPAYLATLATRAANRPATIGTNDLGAVSTRLLPDGQTVEVLVHAPEEVEKIGVYQAAELTGSTDWTFHGFAVRLDTPVAFQVGLQADRRYVLFANHFRDSDGDQLPDAYEELITGTQSDRFDTDGDGLSDWAEICLHLTSALAADTDGDGTSDGEEIELGLNPRSVTAPGPDPDGDGLDAAMEAMLGTNPDQFDPAPRLNLRHEHKTRGVVMQKFGFRPFQACADCNAPAERFYLQSTFTETGKSICPDGPRTNSTATATVALSPFAPPDVQESFTGVTGPYTWLRPPLQYLGPHDCHSSGTTQTDQRTDLHLAGNEHYTYTPPDEPCPGENNHRLEFTQTLAAQLEYTDALLVNYANVALIPEFSAWPDSWFGVTNHVYSGPNAARIGSVSNLHLADPAEVLRDGGHCPPYTGIDLQENLHSLASRWEARGSDTNNLEVIAQRGSWTRVALEGAAPAEARLLSLSTLEYHVPADGDNRPAWLVGRRTFRKANGDMVYWRDTGTAGTEEPEIKPPQKPGQVFVIPEPIRIEPVAGVHTLVTNQYVMAWGGGPSTSAVFRISLNDTLAGVDWTQVPGTTVGLHVAGPAGGASATWNGQPMPFGASAFGPASGLYVPNDFELSFTQPGAYAFSATLEGPAVAGERKLVGWQVVVASLDLDADLDNDGNIDDLDEPYETQGLGEIVRVNDSDDLNQEDDFQYVELRVTPANLGRAWITYDPTKLRVWSSLSATSQLSPGSESNPNWNPALGQTAPAFVYVEGLVASGASETSAITFGWSLGDVELTDSLSITIAGELGHSAYFAAIPDYIKEFRGPTAPDYRLFEDELDAPGGPEGATHNLVAMLTHDVTMTVHDARAAGHEYYGHVKAAKPNSAVILNASYFEQTWPAGMAKGICVNGGMHIANSRILINAEPNQYGSNGDWHYASRGWFGQMASDYSWTYGVPSGGVPPEPATNGTIRAAVGGILPFLASQAGNMLPGHAFKYNDAASNMIGWSNNAVLFFAVSNDAANYNPDINLASFVDQFSDSGAITVFGMDGSSSIAFSHVDRLGLNLDKDGEAGSRHMWGITWGTPFPTHRNERVSNYILIDWR